MPKAKAKKGAAARPVLVRRSARSVRARSVRAPARLAEEAPVEPIASDDDSSNASADDGLRRQIAELQAQLRKASVRLDAATASTSASDADVMAPPSMSAGLLPRSLPPAAPPVEPTPLLPPAPPSSQDLLASILQQMMTPVTTAGEHDGASGGDIALFFVLGATLDPKVKAKIREGSYVDLGSLGAPSDASVSVAMGSYGQPSISLTPSRAHPPARPPASILEWIRLFGVYASVYVERHPAESPSLFSYTVNVMDLHRRHGGVAWRLYDERFR